MKKLRWLGAGGAAGLVLALAFVGSATAGHAIASYQSATLDVSGPTKLGGRGTTTIHVSVAPTDDPTAKATIYVPKGYATALSAPSGTQVGTVDAKVVAADLAGAVLPVTGTITVTDASAVLTVSGAQVPITTLATQCTTTPTHAAFLLLNLSAGGQAIQVPVFVDPAVGGETAFASFKLQLCLGPPDVPAGTPGRETFGIKLIDAKLNLTGVFTNPTAAGPYLWSAFLVPYTPAVGTANAAAAIEIRSAVLLPVNLTLKGKYDKKKKAAVLTGTLTIGGLADISGVAPFLFSGSKPSKLKPAGRAGKTAKSGAFTSTKKILKTTYFAVALGINPTDDTAEVCQGVSLAPAGCVNGTIGGFAVASNVVKITVPPKKKK
jgi:hypothetical protein